MMSRRGLRRLVVGSVITASLCAVVAVALAVAYSDSLVRWSMMRRLCSEDSGERQRGVNYMVRQIAGNDPPEVNDAGRAATIAYAREMLIEADDACFETIVAGLSAAGAWGADMGEPWVRYLAKRAREVGDAQQSAIAVELGKLAWRRGEHHDDSRVVLTIEYLLKDDSADVRLNALSAAAALPPAPEGRVRLLRIAAGDAEPVIRERAERMLAMLDVEGSDDEALSGKPRAPEPPDDAIPGARRLAELEAMATASADLAVTEDMPYLIRLQTVRVSRSAEPEDLLPLFESEQATLRDIAAVVARERFSDAELRRLATRMLESYDDRLRMAGAIVAGMAGRDEELIELLKLRAANATDWIVQQHFNLGLMMQAPGSSPEGFDPAALLSHERMPRTTVVLAMLEMGRLEGMDWLLNPFGEPPTSLAALLDQFRWWLVVRRYFPGAIPGAEFWLWADREVQQRQAERLRDWYLLHRPTMRFGSVTRVFTTEAK